MLRTATHRPLRTLLVGVAATTVGLAALPAVRADDAPPGSGAALSKLLIKFRVTGTFEDYDPLTNVATFSFAGPFFAPSVGADGRIADGAGKALGRVEHATVEFRPGPDSDRFRFTCADCQFRFDDGSVLEPLLPDPDSPWDVADIPMEGRMLVELGPVPNPDPAVIMLRGAGCGGSKETAGHGRLAGQRGAVCVNGVFGFPAALHNLAPAALADNPQWLGTVSGNGESDCTLVFHTPAHGP